MHKTATLVPPVPAEVLLPAKPAAAPVLIPAAPAVAAVIWAATVLTTPVLFAVAVAEGPVRVAVAAVLLIAAGVVAADGYKLFSFIRSLVKFSGIIIIPLVKVLQYELVKKLSCKY